MPRAERAPQKTALGLYLQLRKRLFREEPHRSSPDRSDS
jgi:hypothetical protein